ncbi:DUF1631 family protein [Formivibrio citricus]|nr:DUF1631 family protein [Formivibrio citricus]
MSEEYKAGDSTGPAAATSSGVRGAIDPKLVACRDMALQLLMQSFEGVFSKLDEDFLERADKATDRVLRESFLLARAETQAKRSLITAEFRQRFLESFNNRLRELDGGKGEINYYQPVSGVAELSLVANDEYEESLAASHVTNAFKQKSWDDLQQLESRLARLLPMREEGSEEGGNPISPEAICEAVLAACRQIECGVDARIVALRAFERQLASQVAAVYKQVNEFLVQQNVQPVVMKLRPRGAGGRASGGERESGGQDILSGGAVVSGADAGAPSEDAQLPPGMVNVAVPAVLAAHLEQLLSGNFSAPSTAPATVRLSSELGFLDQLQRRLPDDVAVVEGVTMHPARDNLVALLQNTQWAQNLAQMDAMTLNLVALLFDRMFEDPRLPDAVKGLIGRLQIPVLKVALLDSTFFARKGHPARQLLDRLAESAVDWNEGSDSGKKRIDKFSAIVSWVVVNFENDVSIFEHALADLESFLLDEADAAANQVLEDAEELAATEQSELAVATAEAVIGGRLFRREVPPLVDEFVRQCWQPVLVRAYGAAGENEPRFVAYVAALDDLLWSVEPKRGAEERLLLVNRLPGMLKTLEEGADYAGMDAEARQLFFSELVHCHAAAIRNGMRPVAAVPVVAPPPEPIKPLPRSEAEPVYEMALPPSALPERWDWVDLQEVDGMIRRLRLTWVSPQGTRFLFTNREGENGHTFVRSEVEQLLQQGKMRRADLSESLTDKVFNILRQSLVA